MGSIPVGDSDFSLSHARDMLNIPSFLKIYNVFQNNIGKKKDFTHPCQADNKHKLYLKRSIAKFVYRVFHSVSSFVSWKQVILN